MMRNLHLVNNHSHCMQIIVGPIRIMPNAFIPIEYISLDFVHFEVLSTQVEFDYFVRIRSREARPFLLYKARDHVMAIITFFVVPSGGFKF